MRFRPDRLPNEVDFILIGSGISNLVLGGLLSRLGWRILILEQHDIAGGSTHTFKDKGFVFDIVNLFSSLRSIRLDDLHLHCVLHSNRNQRGMTRTDLSIEYEYCVY